MCGIVGIIDKYNSIYGAVLDRFEDMLILDSLRGKDSTGAFCVYKSGPAYLIKQPTQPHNLFDHPDWKKFRDKAIKSSTILVGHNRKATIGNISAENAHPFHEGKIILVHNGGIHNHDKLDTKWKSDVDSQMIAKALNDEAPDKLLPKLQGAFALVWYDLRDKCLYMIRNSQRPLWMAETSTSYYFASEPWMYYAPLSRQGIKPTEQFELKEWVLYKFDTKTKQFFPKEIKQHVSYTGYYNEYEDHATYVPPTTTTTRPLYLTNSEHSPSKLSSLSVQGSDIVDLYPLGKIVSGDHIVHSVDRVITDSANGRIKIYGKCVSPGKIDADVVSLTSMFDLKEANIHFKTKHKLFISKVTNCTYPACGPTAWVCETLPIECIDDFFGNNVPVDLIPEIYGEEAECVSCKTKELDIGDVMFSRVKQTNVSGLPNKWYILCPNCVGDSIKDKKDQDEFIENYFNAVQARLPEQQKPSTVH